MSDEKPNSDKPISKSMALQAFAELDQDLAKTLALIVGGGTSMVLAHGYPLATADIDAIPKHVSFEEIDASVKKVAMKLGLPGDWLNPYFSSFTHVLPADYSQRLIRVFSGRHLEVEALGREDMLIMKCFAHRPKDLGHARALLKAGVDTSIVEDAIEACLSRGVPGAQAALDFLDELIEDA
jgi:hypothetical protein